MKVILHIGPHKTGTTAIQTFMRANAAVLAKFGIGYPQFSIGAPHNHHGIVYGLQDPRTFEETVVAIKSSLDELAQVGMDTAVLSSEVFVQHPVPIERLPEVFSGHDLHVLAYLRRPDHLWASAYTELLTDPYVRRTSKIYEDPVPYDCSCSTVLVPWMMNFKPDHMVLAPFDSSQWPGGNLFGDFLSMVGAPADAFGACDVAGVRRNEGLPVLIAEAVRRANRWLRLSEPGHKGMTEAARRIAPFLPRFMAKPPRLRLASEIQACFAMLEPWLDTYRMYFRSGFDDTFLRCPFDSSAAPERSAPPRWRSLATGANACSPAWRPMMRPKDRSTAVHHGEPVRFCIVTAGRTGSTRLRLLLESHPSVTCHGEVLGKNLRGIAEPGTAQHGKMLIERAHDPAGFISRRVFAPTGSRAIGFKALYEQLVQDYPAAFGAIRADPGIRIVHLVRRNAVKRFVSEYAVGTLKFKHRYMHHEDPPRVEPMEIPIDALLADLERYERAIGGMRHALGGHQVHEIAYEDSIDPAGAAMGGLLEFLDVPPDRLWAPLRKILSEDLRHLISNFDAVAAALKGSRYESMLH
jgi:hypothetical protein